jgi:hypothetical protein
MDDDKITQIKEELAGLKERYREREASIPAHSIRPHQLIELEELEEEIAEKEKELARLENDV